MFVFLQSHLETHSVFAIFQTGSVIEGHQGSEHGRDNAKLKDLQKVSFFPTATSQELSGQI